MNANTQRLLVAGPAGALDVAVDAPAAEVPPRGIAVVCHPHPQHGGTMDNKVADALAVIAAQRDAQLPLALAGFSFGGYVAAQAAARLAAGGAPAERLVLV